MTRSVSFTPDAAGHRPATAGKGVDIELDGEGCDG